MQRKHSWGLLVASLLAMACAPDLGETLGDGSDTTAGDGGSAGTTDGGEGGPQVEHEDEGGGVTRTVVDATSNEQWIYLDLETRQQVVVDDPQASDAWDLGFQRFNITINGGISGGGGMEAVVLADVAFADVTQVPTDGWVTDAADGDDENEDLDLAFAGWYAYDFMTHVLTPHPQVYVVRTVEGGTFKLEILEYYDPAGTSAIFTIRWAPVGAP